MKKTIYVLTVMLLGLALLTPSALAQEDDSAGGEDPGEGGGALDITHADDVIIEGRLCSSDQDNCVDGEDFLSFGPSGFQLEYKAKDNSPAIGFDTTGTGDADWVIGSNGADDLLFEYDENPGGAGDAGTVMAMRVPGLVGINEISPEAPLHVVGDDTVTTATEVVFILESDVAPQQIFDNTSTGAEWFFAMTSDDQFKISRNGTGMVEAKFFENGNLQLAGTLIQGSDATNKNNFTEIDTGSILDTIAALPITEWNYIGDEARHVGPTAQDFAAAFGLGDTTTGIAAIDADGVALAAIQALAIENDTLRSEIEGLSGSNGTSPLMMVTLIAALAALALAAHNSYGRRKTGLAA